MQTDDGHSKQARGSFTYSSLVYTSDRQQVVEVVAEVVDRLNRDALAVDRGERKQEAPASVNSFR